MATRSGGETDRPRREGGSSGPRRQYFRRKKVCKFCTEKIDFIDYKDVNLIGQFVSDRGRILPRRLTGTCSSHQHSLTTAIQRARNIALLAFASEL